LNRGNVHDAHPASGVRDGARPPGLARPRSPTRRSSQARWTTTSTSSRRDRGCRRRRGRREGAAVRRAARHWGGPSTVIWGHRRKARARQARLTGVAKRRSAGCSRRYAECCNDPRLAGAPGQRLARPTSDERNGTVCTYNDGRPPRHPGERISIATTRASPAKSSDAPARHLARSASGESHDRPGHSRTARVRGSCASSCSAIASTPARRCSSAVRASSSASRTLLGAPFDY
jgi:hypothetical protein